MALIVIEVETRSSGMSSNSRAMSSIESIATPVLPTSFRPRVIRIQPHLRREVERHGQPRLPVIEQVPEATVRLGGRAHPGVLTHRPEPPPIHVRVDAACERELAGLADHARSIVALGRSIDRLELDPGIGSSTFVRHRQQRSDGRCKMVAVDWVAGFYRKQYEWADWRNRWADFDPARADPHVDAVRRLAGDGSKRILELGAGTGSTAAALAAQDTTS